MDFLSFLLLILACYTSIDFLSILYRSKKYSWALGASSSEFKFISFFTTRVCISRSSRFSAKYIVFFSSYNLLNESLPLFFYVWNLIDNNWYKVALILWYNIQSPSSSDSWYWNMRDFLWSFPPFSPLLFVCVRHGYTSHIHSRFAICLSFINSENSVCIRRLPMSSTHVFLEST